MGKDAGAGEKEWGGEAAGTGVGMAGDICWKQQLEQVTGRALCQGGLSDPIASTIGVKQGCPLSPTLFGLYIDKISDYILRAGAESDLEGTPIHIMLYADDIILVSETKEGLQCHLRALDDFCIYRGLTVNLGKTKVMYSTPPRQSGVEQYLRQQEDR
ncbi:hypothetical protein L7F22_062070 [Adiantum nelumboides]|nr:hypothetical protein [Adiantum nelumboides]